uniref:Uncharacterized protein n=1 Tax=Ascaris lumbricoides TaxID=6252 RepID=A0A9J2P1V2_ASCLU
MNVLSVGKQESLPTLTAVSENEYPLSEEDRCMEPLDPGPCQYYQVKWFWDKADEECKEFHYGGCLGSRNRFDNKQLCMKQCIYKMHNPVAVPDLCLLDPNPGHCDDDRTGQWWYYFNPVTGECDKFFYYGCGGNDNRFYSLYQCRKILMNAAYIWPNAIVMRGVRIRSVRTLVSVWPVTEVTVDTVPSLALVVRLLTAQIAALMQLARMVFACAKRDSSEMASTAQRRSGKQKKKTPIHPFVGSHCKEMREEFPDVNECLRAPYICDKNAECRNVDDACLDSFDRGYQEQCGTENWREHYYLDHQTKRCSLFWYDGCPGTSRNIFSSLETCETMCEMSNVLARAGNWQQRFYFDHASMTCRLFWYDGCSSKSRNIFDDLLTCQWLCEEQPLYKSRSCLEPFDEHYRDECNGGRWRRQFFFDKHRKKCVAFWYDGCTGESQNIFQDEMTCMQLCEEPTRKDQPNVTNICDFANPCENNGTCHFDRSKNTHYCKCLPGYTNANCTEKIEFDPCSSNPCKNGATCSAKAGRSKTTFECFCAIGYGGELCESKPCESNPCLNNGTCRTTRGFSTFFCDCPPKFGGKYCDIAVGETKPPTYGKNVQLLSSGKVEWIEQLKKVKAKEREMKLKEKARQSDQPAKDSSEPEKARKKELRQIAKEEDKIDEKINVSKVAAHSVIEENTQPSNIENASIRSSHFIDPLIRVIFLFVVFSYEYFV